MKQPAKVHTRIPAFGVPLLPRIFGGRPTQLSTFGGLILFALSLWSCRNIAITGVQVYDVHSGTMLPGRTVVLKKEKILAVREVSPSSSRNNRRRIDASGKYLIPGLIDAHSHLIYILDSVDIPGEEGLPYYLAAGVTTLKLYVYADTAVYRRVIEEGHRHGLTVAAHLPSNRVRTADALSWGVDVIEHIWGVPEDSALLALMLHRGVMVDPTLVVFRNMLFFPENPAVWNHPDLQFMPDTLRALWDRYRHGRNLDATTLPQRSEQMQAYLRTTRKIFDLGIPILAGTDSPEPYCPPGFALHEELALLVEAGLPPAAALNCATIQNARALRQAHRLGSVEAGKQADLLLLDKNPLEDICNSRSIYRVIHRGRVLEPAEILKKMN